VSSVEYLVLIECSTLNIRLVLCSLTIREV